MDSLPVLLALGALVLAGAGFLFTRSARRRADPGDFEQRLEDMRRGRAFPGSHHAPPGGTPRPEPEPVDEEGGDDEEALPPAPTLEEYAAPRSQARVYDDPDLGEFVYDPEGEEWSQQNDGGAVPWYHIEAGEDGPTEVQRRCLSRFLERENAIVDRAFDALFAHFDSRREQRPVAEVASVYVEVVTPDEPFARGCIFFRFDGYQGLPATVATTDDWDTVTCEVDASLEEED